MTRKVGNKNKGKHSKNSEYEKYNNVNKIMNSRMKILSQVISETEPGHCNYLKNKEEKKFENNKKLWELQHNIVCSNICVIGFPKGRKKNILQEEDGRGEE